MAILWQGDVKRVNPLERDRCRHIDGPEIACPTGISLFPATTYSELIYRMNEDVSGLTQI